MTEKTIWVLADDRAGNTSQSLGVAEISGLKTEIKKVRYTNGVLLPNVLRGASTIGATKETVDGLTGPFPDVAIAAGRRAAPLLRYIKKKSGGKTKIVQIMYPGRFGLSDFDLLVLPNHDGCRLVRPNIMRVTGAPNRITDEKLKTERQKWMSVFETMPSPRIALIVGGATKDKPFTVDMARDFAKRAMKLREKSGGGSFLVTTSRRTGKDQEKAIRDELADPVFFYEWGNTAYENPYFGFLAWADAIVVTGDSVSMCSEACAASAPVYIYAPAESVGKKHAKLHAELYRGGYANELVAEPEKIGGGHPKLSSAVEIAKRILEMVK